MDSSPPPEKSSEFRKLSNDVASRKYRRHSTSSSDGEMKNDGRELQRNSGGHQSSRSGDSRRHHDRPSSRSSHRHDVYDRYEKHADDEDRHHRVSSRYGREAARPDRAYGDNDRDRHRGRDGYSHRSRGDRMKDEERECKGDRHNQSRGHPVESSGRERDRHHYRESNKKENWELDALKEKEHCSRDPKNDVDDQDSLPKKPKLFDSSSDVDGNKNGVEQKPMVEQGRVNTSVAANDVYAAKVAAMKAAELVNKNLVGVGFMSTEQKKKLLWGNKKSTASEEVGPKWNTAMFGDRERQEKFNKLMGVKGDVKMENNTEEPDNGDHMEVEKQKELQMDLEKQYTAGLRRRDGRTVGLGL